MQPTSTNVSNKKIVLIMLAFVGSMFLVFILFIVGMAVFGGGKTGSSGKAELFITDFIQADKKAPVVFFANDKRLNGADFQAQVNAIKDQVRSGGYTSKPVSVEPSKTNTPEYRWTAYKVCKPNSNDCLLLRVETFQNRYIEAIESSSMSTNNQ